MITIEESELEHAVNALKVGIEIAEGASASIMSSGLMQNAVNKLERRKTEQSSSVKTEGAALSDLNRSLELLDRMGITALMSESETMSREAVLAAIKRIAERA